MRVFAIVLLLLVFVGCENKSDTQEAHQESDAGARVEEDPFVGIVIETMDSGGYTYVLVDTGKEQIWAAGPRRPMELETIVLIGKSMAMPDFYSETLERSFDMLYFVTRFGPDDDVRPHGAEMSSLKSSKSHGEMAAGSPVTGAVEVDLTGIEAAEQTVAAVHADRASLAGMPVRVRGKVVKVLPRIMGTNWMHIQDGTGGTGTDDLTVTTDTPAPVGSTVVVEGLLGVDVDFGSGYEYDVIIQGAKVTVE